MLSHQYPREVHIQNSDDTYCELHILANHLKLQETLIWNMAYAQLTDKITQTFLQLFWPLESDKWSIIFFP